MSTAVLIIDDEATLAANIATYLARLGHDARTAGSAEEGLAQLATFRPDVVLLDHNLPGTTGLALLERLRDQGHRAKVVMMTGHGSIDLAVAALKAGAADFLTKPFALGSLRLLLERLGAQDRLERTVDYFQQRQAEGSGLAAILGASPAVEALRGQIRRLIQAETQLADADPPTVLIQGETGAGKELVARALHFNGRRRQQPFVELNCGALPAQLVEAELFGYEKGAFTDARQRKAGLVETAEGGTLFLDEIGEADASTQVRLLKLLEDKRVRRLGGLRDQAVDVRILAATHRPLDQLVREGRFRADLYYRLRVADVQVPPLRDRGEDIVLLARTFLEHQAHRYRRERLTLSASAELALRHHHWPGNVRELRNAIERAVMMAAGPILSPQDLGFLPGLDRAGVDDPDDLDLGRAERRLIVRALERADQNITQAARLLGISRDTLRYRLERLGLRDAPPGDMPRDTG